MLRLVLVFAVLSALGFGGGNAVFPQMYVDSVEVYHWVTAPQFAADFALARLSPGPATGISALIGLAVGGLPGAALAAIAMFVPAALIVLALSALYDRFREHPWRALFQRVMIPIVLGLSWVGVLLLARGALGGWQTWVIGLAATGLMLWTRINASLIIVAAGALGALILR
ncbi:MAG TPA: chromate transporter [Candidatus Lustribacter sp.]|nr:chromate transporter [Candidatus Lustribacter sp.]